MEFFAILPTTPDIEGFAHAECYRLSCKELIIQVRFLPVVRDLDVVDPVFCSVWQFKFRDEQ